MPTKSAMDKGLRGSPLLPPSVFGVLQLRTMRRERPTRRIHGACIGQTTDSLHRALDVTGDYLFRGLEPQIQPLNAIEESFARRT